MALPESTLWHLHIIRETIALAAPTVSLSFFWWWKEPGNSYTTFYPTAWLPSADDPSKYADSSLGESIFQRAVRPWAEPFGVTVADYGDATIEVPAWSSRTGQQRVICQMAGGLSPQGAARQLLSALDLEWLAANGNHDDKISQLVIGWLGEVINLAARPSAESIQMEYSKNKLPMALWMLEVFDSATGITHDIWWPDRNLSLKY